MLKLHSFRATIPASNMSAEIAVEIDSTNVTLVQKEVSTTDVIGLTKEQGRALFAALGLAAQGGLFD